MRPLLALTSALLLAGCDASVTRGYQPCSSDEECGGGQLCFAEGCGDPGSNIVVEIEGSALSGQFARDVPLETGRLGASQNFDLGAPLFVSGEFQRERSAISNPTDRTYYADPVVVTATGTSSLLPGISRVYEGRFSSAERGAFRMRLGAGDFVLTAMPGDRTVPPAVTRTTVAPSAGTPAVTFVFPAADGAPALTGQVIKKLDTSTSPPESVLISTAFTITGTPVPSIELQLFDVDNTPLSQRFPIASTSGEFAITMSPEARSKPTLILVASPRDPGVEIPTKRFVVDPQMSSSISLEYGDFGEAAEVTGTILDRAGAPVAGAQVVLEGTVVGDGVFRSTIVETDASGVFKVRSLGSKSDGSFQLSVVPPKESRAAYSRRQVTVKVTRDAAGTLSAQLTPSSLSLDDRLVARGLVLRPSDGRPASGVFVRATLQVEKAAGTTAEKSLPIESADAVTGPDGTFEFPLDPGVWRFEYTPGQELPISTRLVTIKPEIDAMTGEKLPTQELTPVQLSFGRTVSGLVTGDMGSLLARPLPFAQLRFFRVTTVEGRPASILLGKTIADDRGKYELVLPTVQTAEK